MTVVNNAVDYNVDERASAICMNMADIGADSSTVLLTSWVCPVDGVLMGPVYFGGTGTTGTNERIMRLRHGVVSWVGDFTITDVGANIPFGQLVPAASAVNLAVAAGTVMNCFATTGNTTTWTDPSVSFYFRATPD